MREIFGLACMALMFQKSEKVSPPSNRTGYITETINAIHDYKSQPGVFVVPLSPPPPPSPTTGFLPLLLSVLLSVFSLLSEEIIDMILHLIMSNGVFLVVRILRRMCTAAYRRFCGVWARGQVTGEDSTHNTRQSQGEIDDLSRSTPAQTATTTLNGLNTGTNIEDSPESMPLQAVTATSYNHFSRHHIEKCRKGFLILTRWLLAATTYILRAIANATFRCSRQWLNDEEIQSSMAEIPSNTPSPSTTEQILADVRADSARKDEQIARKEDRIAKLTKAANASSSTIANLNQRNSRLSMGIRRTLDPKGLYPDDTNVLMIANHVRQDLNRISKKVVRQRKDLEKSTAHQQNEQLLEKAVEIATLSAENERLRGSVLGLEQGQQSSVEEVERIQQAAKKREEKLTDQRMEAQRKLSNAIDPRTYDTLRNQFDVVRDALFRVTAERDAANAALEAEEAQTQPEAQEQSEHPVTVETDAVQEAIEQVADLEPKAAARDEEMEEAKRKAQEAETRAQEAETKAQDADGRVQSAEARAEAAEQNNLALKEDLQMARDAAEKSSQRQKLMEQRMQSMEARLESSDVAQGANPVGMQSASQQEASTQTEQSNEDASYSYQEGRQAAILECEQAAVVLIANTVDQERQLAQRQINAAIQQERQQMQQQINTAVASRDSAWTARVNAHVEDEVVSRERPLRAELTTAVQRAATAGERANEAEQRASTESSRAEAAEEELRKQRQERLSQDEQMNIYRGEIANLRRRIPRDADLVAAQLRSVGDGRRRAHAIIGESLNSNYSWKTRQALVRLFSANEQIMELERLLEDPETRSSQVVFLKVLLDAEIPQDMYMELDQRLPQVVAKQCKAVNVRLDALKTIINESDQPDKVRLLTEIYKSRGDEDTVYDTGNSTPEPSSDEDEDDNQARAQTPAPDAPRNTLIPTLRRARPAAVPQDQNTPPPSDLRGDPRLKRKEADDVEASASSKRRDASQMEMRPIARPSRPFPQQRSSSLTAADDSIETESETQNEVSSSERDGDPASQSQSNDQTDISAQLPSLPAQHSSSPNPVASSETPSHAPHFKPTRIPGPKPKPTLTASERQQRLRYRQNPESEPSSEQEMTASSSAQGSTSFSFTMPKNIASGIRPHVRKYTRLSGLTNIVPSPRPSSNASSAEQWPPNLSRTITLRRGHGR